MKRRNRVTGTREFVLGLLAKRPMSGYDIRQLLSGLSWLVDSPSFGTLYPGLHALHADGLVTVKVIPNDSRPPRKIYSITDAGRATLREWLAQPEQRASSLREFVMRLALAGSLSEAGLTDLLEQRRQLVASVRPKIEDARTAAGEEDDVGRYLTLDYGLALADAELAWLERTLSHAQGRQQPVAAPTR